MKTSRSIQIWCGLGIVLLGLAVRWPLLRQSLWYDEMTTLVEYVLQPWSKVLAAGTGEYVPNNHVLHTALVKLIYGGAIPPNEVLLRLPALAAGLLVPIALAWPMRKSDPGVALLVAIVAALHPWLVDFSVEARGYSLVLLLGIAGTNLLAGKLAAARLSSPKSEAASPVGFSWAALYAVVMALAIYTVPLAVLLIPAHGVAVLVLRRKVVNSWLIGSGIAMGLSILLYLPMYRGLISYYRNPYLPTMNYRGFLNALPRCAMTGVSIPNSPAIFWALPVVTIVIGSVLGWSRVSLRPALVTLGVATLLGAMLPLMSSAATEVRFVPWILPWFCLSAVAVFCAPPVRFGRFAGMLGLVVLISWQIAQDVTLLPQQPIREGIHLADRITPPGRDIMVLYLGARESIALYGDTSHRLLPAPDVNSMIAMERKSIAETGHLPWVVIFYEKLALERNFAPPESRGLWTGLLTRYDVDRRLPGRITPVAIYRPK